MVASSCQHGTSSYTSSTALGKTKESRRSNSPRRCYRGQLREYLYYHGRLQDPRISPGQLQAKSARSERRSDSSSAPKKRGSRLGRNGHHRQNMHRRRAQQRSTRPKDGPGDSQLPPETLVIPRLLPNFSEKPPNEIARRKKRLVFRCQSSTGSSLVALD